MHNNTDPMVGQVIEGYRILRLHGRGRSSNIYFSEQVISGLHAATKLLSPQYMTDEGIQLFTNDIKIAINADNPRIVRIVGAGIIGGTGTQYDGYPYLHMKFMENGSLSNLMKNAEQNISKQHMAKNDAEYDILLANEADRLLQNGNEPYAEKVLSFIHQVLDGLDYLHTPKGDKGIILHQDLHPANVLIDDEFGACIADFGLSRIVTGSQSLSKYSHSPLDLPEDGPLFKGSVTADIAHVGALIQYMYTGIFTIHRHKVTSMPDELEAIIDKSMQGDPYKRYQSAGEMQAAINSAKESLETKRAHQLYDAFIKVVQLQQLLTSEQIRYCYEMIDTLEKQFDKKHKLSQTMHDQIDKKEEKDYLMIKQELRKLAKPRNTSDKEQMRVLSRFKELYHLAYTWAGRSEEGFESSFEAAEDSAKKGRA